jgi:eukaryotic-like serine/threonine-protein kinase
LASQVADYEIMDTVVDDGVVPCLRARRPSRLGGDAGPVTIWVLGPLARTPWNQARARLEPLSCVRSENLPAWLEAGTGEWAQRPVVWVSASTPVTGTLVSPPAEMDVPARLRALAAAARGAHALHEQGIVHGAICPQAVALVAGGAVLAPPSLADGRRPVALVGYPPLGYTDPQLLRGEAGRWSDVWSLGATIRQVVTGSAPFPGIDDLPVVQALSRLLMVPAPTPGEMPDAISGLVNACLSPDPTTRPSTADEVAGKLEQAAGKW